MSVLIDHIANSKVAFRADGPWWIAKPLPPLFWQRVRDAWAVLTGRCLAVHFKESP